MKPLLFLAICFSFFLFIPFQKVNGQGQKPYGDFSSQNKKTQKSLLKAARNESNYGNYTTAIEKYSELLKIDSTNSMYNFEMAQTLYDNFLLSRSIPYYEKAIKYSKDTLGEAYYFLAMSYHLSSNYIAAQKNYNTYLSILTVFGTGLQGEEEKALKDDIRRKIEMCDNGKKLIQYPLDKFTLNGKTRPFQIIATGKNVNSDYDDYGAVLSANDSLMYFTSRRDGSVGGKFDYDDKYFEDSYVSKAGKRGWEKSSNLGSPINTKKHEAVISISPDGQTIYFYRGIKQGTFFSSKLVGNTWTKPDILYKESHINTEVWEISMFGFTLAGDELYMVGDREGGLGGRDIYISKKQKDGSWGTLKDMGEPINSKYDEDAPFITADGKTMYFSSTGHNSMGGFDIFKSERKGDNWSEPVNLGVPFNTPGNDIYFVIANTSDRAYYSSNSISEDGKTHLNIYVIDMCDEIPVITISGLATGISKGTILVSEKESGNQVGTSEITNGKYSFRLEHGKNYKFTLNVNEIEPTTAEISIPKMCKVHDIYQELSFSKAGQPLVYKNAFFDIKEEAGSGNYSEFLSKADKSSLTNYNEVSVNTVPVCDEISVITISGLAIGISKGTILVSEKESGNQVAASEIKNSNYSFKLEHGKNYKFTLNANEIEPATAEISIPKMCKVYDIYQELSFSKAGRPFVYKNAFFDIKKEAGSGNYSAFLRKADKTSLKDYNEVSVNTVAIAIATATIAATTTVTASTATTTTTSTTTTGSTTTTTISINNILFDYDKSAIKEEFKSELDKAVDFLKNANKKAKIEVAGYTDSKGSDQYNLALSKRRAEAVANYLASKGISRGRIKTIGYGESKPIASNENPDGSDNADGRAKNRRTEIVVVQ